MSYLSSLAENLSGAAEVYEVPDDDLVGEVLIPAMSSAASVRVGAGFFGSMCLGQLAPGLSAFVATRTEPLRLLISPAVSAEDQQAIASALRQPEEVLEKSLSLLFESAALSPARVVQHTVDCLAYLIAANRLDLRVVLMPRGQYHKKLWLFSSGDDWLAVHGSGNATQRGLLVNGEQMTIDRSWCDGLTAEKRIKKLAAGWEGQWENRNPNSVTITARQSLRLLQELGSGALPTTSDFWEAWRLDQASGLAPDLPPGLRAVATHGLNIPFGMNWQSGRYSHQGQAVAAFRESGNRGILAVATGGGKTKTSLVAATLYQNEHQGTTVIVVLVPSTPLAQQWAEEIRAFGVQPFMPSKLLPERRRARLQELRAAVSLGLRRTEVLVVTNQLFALDDNVRNFIDSCGPKVRTMLIADEVHNLGVSSFLDNPPERFDARLGLSATPVRQYDPAGTARLFGFFGGEIFEFALSDAIQTGCLVPYNYHLHEVQLGDEEMDRYVDLTDKLRRAGFQADDDGFERKLDDKIKALLRERRSVLEHADEKLACLGDLLMATGPHNVGRTLIYASGKKPPPYAGRQIDAVNHLLNDLRISFHQFTSAETMQADSGRYLESFAAGDYQVLTAMKVLDEGIDLPQTDVAFLLSSSTVRREWVQRRGRILRTAPGKHSATLHDFLVLPPSLETAEGRAILRGELSRANEFASLAQNEFDPSGPRAAVISKYEDRLWVGGPHAVN